MSSKTKIDKTLQDYKNAYLDFKTNRNAESEKRFFVTKQSLHNMFETINSYNNDENLDNTKTLLHQRKRIQDLKDTLNGLKNETENSLHKNSSLRRKYIFQYNMWREHIFLILIILLFMTFIYYMRKDNTVSTQKFISDIKNIITTRSTPQPQ